MLNRLLDKIILITICIASYIQNELSIYVVVPIIVVLIISSINSYLENDIIKIISLMLYSASCIFAPQLLFFLPLICYDILLSKWQWTILIAIFPLSVGLLNYPLITIISAVLYVFLAFFLKQRVVMLERTKSEYISLRDAAKEFSIQLEGKNKDLLEKQDYEINLATLNERNRIAREIHDNVGHLLSRSILQIGALMTTCKDTAFKESLNTLKTTLSEGMTSIRNSIHNLHDESVDLSASVTELTKEFTFCPISLDYDISGNPDKMIKYTFISVIKEALSNIIKHSDATLVTITLREHPALYQLIINKTKEL